MESLELHRLGHQKINAMNERGYCTRAWIKQWNWPFATIFVFKFRGHSSSCTFLSVDKGSNWLLFGGPGNSINILRATVRASRKRKLSLRNRVVKLGKWSFSSNVDHVLYQASMNHAFHQASMNYAKKCIWVIFSWLFKILVDFEVAELTLFSSFSAINFKRLGLGARMWSLLMFSIFGHVTPKSEMPVLTLAVAFFDFYYFCNFYS